MLQFCFSAPFQCKMSDLFIQQRKQVQKYANKKEFERPSEKKRERENKTEREGV